MKKQTTRAAAVEEHQDLSEKENLGSSATSSGNHNSNNNNALKPRGGELSRREQLELWRQQRRLNEAPPSARKAAAAAATTTSSTALRRNATRPGTSHAAPSAAKAVSRQLQQQPNVGATGRPAKEVSPPGGGPKGKKKVNSALNDRGQDQKDAAVTREEQLKRYRGSQQRIKEHAVRVGRPHKPMNSAADQPRTRVVPSRLSTTTTKLSGSVTDIELKLFRKKIKKAMQCSQRGDHGEARAIFKTLQEQEQFRRFRSTSEYWVALARFEEECQNFAEVVRLLDTASLACANKVEDSFHLGNALAGFLIRVNGSANGVAAAHGGEDDTAHKHMLRATPTQRLAASSNISSPFFFNELAPESEDFLHECLQKARPLDRSCTPPSSPAQLNASVPSPYHRLRQVVETIKASPRSAHLPNRSPLSSQHYLAQSPYAELSIALPMPASKSSSVDDSDIQVTDFPIASTPVEPATPQLRTGLPASPPPPELSESFHQLTSSGRKSQFLQSPSAPRLTLTTRLALGEVAADGLELQEARLIEWEDELMMASPSATTPHRRMFPSRLSNPQRIPLQPWDQQAPTKSEPSPNAASPTLHPYQRVDRPTVTRAEEACEDPATTTSSSHKADVDLICNLATLSLTSANVSSSFDAYASAHEPTTIGKNVSDASLPLQAESAALFIKSRKSRFSASVRVSEIQATTPGYGRFHTFAPVRRTGSMRNADPLEDILATLSPIAPTLRSSIPGQSTPGIVEPPTPILHVEDSREEERLENGEKGQLAYTPVRRSLRLNSKATTPMAKMNTPFPFGRDRFPRNASIKEPVPASKQTQGSGVLVLANPHLKKGEY